MNNLLDTNDPGTTQKPAIDVGRLLQVIHRDPVLPDQDRNMLSQFLHSPDTVSYLASAAGGVAGSAIARSISNYLKLDETSQILLSLAGFGIGSILVKTIGNVLTHDQKPLVTNDISNRYKVHL